MPGRNTSTMPSDSRSGGLSATKRVFTRPANLHLAWSSAKAIASPFIQTSSSSSITPSRITVTTSSSTSVKQLPMQASPIVRIDRPLPSHPYSSFVSRPTDDDRATDIQPKASFSAMSRSPSSPSIRSTASHHEELSGSVLKIGHLTWKDSLDNSSRKGALSGFEKALRRRQAVRDQSSFNDKFVFVRLHQDRIATPVGFTTPNCSEPVSQLPYASGPVLASPGACDPSEFENDGLASLISPPIPSSLSDLNRWVPPTSWDIFGSSLDEYDTCSKSSGSSVSDPLQTPQSSQPGSPKDRETFLDIHSQDVIGGRKLSTSTTSLLMRLRITHDSTAEIQPSFSNDENMTHYCDKQLVVTGELVSRVRPNDLPLVTASGSKHSLSTQHLTCILSSPNMAELNEWLFCIRDAIAHCKGTYFQHSQTRQSIRQLEQLRVRRESEEILQEDIWHHGGKNLKSTPMALSHSLPSPGLQPSSAHNLGTKTSDFSASAFIDYYAAVPPSATASAGSQATTPSASGSAGLYDFEDAYASILARFSDYELSSPLDGLPSTPLDGYVQHARSGRLLDVPVSPCDSEFQEDSWDERQQEPTSPLDPWLTQHGIRFSLSSASACVEEFADEEVMKIFAEGFRRRSSATLPADSLHR